jgi:hypothetical protein
MIGDHPARPRPAYRLTTARPMSEAHPLLPIIAHGASHDKLVEELTGGFLSVHLNIIM